MLLSWSGRPVHIDSDTWWHGLYDVLFPVIRFLPSCTCPPLARWSLWWPYLLKTERLRPRERSKKEFWCVSTWRLCTVVPRSLHESMRKRSWIGYWVSSMLPVANILVWQLYPKADDCSFVTGTFSCLHRAIRCWVWEFRLIICDLAFCFASQYASQAESTRGASLLGWVTQNICGHENSLVLWGLGRPAGWAEAAPCRDQGTCSSLGPWGEEFEKATRPLVAGRVCLNTWRWLFCICLREKLSTGCTAAEPRWSCSFASCRQGNTSFP